VEMAAQKGKADGEIEMANIMRAAALEGDAKMALEVLKHQHGWVAKQAISVEVDQRISITGALAAANERVSQLFDTNGRIIDEALERANDQGLLINNRDKDGDDSSNSNPRTSAFSNGL